MAAGAGGVSGPAARRVVAGAVHPQSINNSPTTGHTHPLHRLTLLGV